MNKELSRAVLIASPAFGAAGVWVGRDRDDAEESRGRS